MRLVDKGWASMEACETVLTRTRVIEMNEWLDAIEEVEHMARKKPPEKPGPASRR